MGRKRPHYHVPPKQFKQLKKNDPHLTSKQIQQKWLDLKKTGISQQKPFKDRSSVNPPVNTQPNTCVKANISKKNIEGESVKNTQVFNPIPCDDTEYYPNLTSI